MLCRCFRPAGRSGRCCKACRDGFSGLHSLRCDVRLRRYERAATGTWDHP